MRKLGYDASIFQKMCHMYSGSTVHKYRFYCSVTYVVIFFANLLEPALQSWAAPLVALPKIDPKISGLQAVFESICRKKSMFFDDFGLTNRGRVCQASGNSAGDTQTSSNNRRSALMAESTPIIGKISQNRPFRDR